VLGEKQEEQVLALVRRYFPNARRAPGSGNVHGDGDILGIPGLYIDVKGRSARGKLSVTKAEWEKAKKQASSMYPPQEPAVVTVSEEIMVHCRLDVLLLALSEGGE